LLKRESDNAYTAFNFFVTAEHILDWLYPKRVNKNKREKMREGSQILKVCSHIANGAKHFEIEDKHHNSVLKTEREGGYFPKNYFHKIYFAKGYFKEARLVVRLSGEAKKSLGATVDVVSLASQILQLWENHQDIKKLGA
jgi:hypothetical protein